MSDIILDPTGEPLLKVENRWPEHYVGYTLVYSTNPGYTTTYCAACVNENDEDIERAALMHDDHQTEGDIIRCDGCDVVIIGEEGEPKGAKATYIVTETCTYSVEATSSEHAIEIVTNAIPGPDNDSGVTFISVSDRRAELA